MEKNYLECRTYEGESSRDCLEIISINGVINTLQTDQIPLTKEGLEVYVIGEDDGKALIILPPGIGIQREITVDVRFLAA